MSTLTELRLRRSELATKGDKLRAEMADIHTRAGDRALSAGEQERWERLERAVEKNRDELRDTLTAMVDAGHATVPAVSLPDHKSDYDRRRQDGALRGLGVDVDTLDRGRRTIDAAFRSGLLPDTAAERATELIEVGQPGEQTLAARWAAAAGNPAYRSAFVKRLGDPQAGHLLWSAEELEAHRAVVAVQAELESRTTMGTGSTGVGAAMIPLTLDPAILLTNDGSNNPLRQLATIKTTLSNTWQGVTSAGATAEWKAEHDEAADGAPTLASPSIPVFLGDVFVPFSYEIGQDGENFLSELTEVMVDAADNLQATAYTIGNGTSAPQGIVTGLAGTASEINGQGSEAYAATDPYDLQNALPARFSANATWQCHIAVANAYRQLETANGSWQFPELREMPPHLLGKRWYENSNMDSALDTGATENNYALIYGDVAKGFFIVDRVGSSLELIPNLFSTTNGRPTAERGAFLHFRTGSECVVPAALRLLDVPTTA